MASKWRLNKKEEKQINEEAATFFQEKLDEGKSKTEAQKAKEDFVKTRTTEMKQAKADANSLKKKAAAAESATGSSTGCIVAAKPRASCHCKQQSGLLPGPSEGARRCGKSPGLQGDWESQPIGDHWRFCYGIWLPGTLIDNISIVIDWICIVSKNVFSWLCCRLSSMQAKQKSVLKGLVCTERLPMFSPWISCTVSARQCHYLCSVLRIGATMSLLRDLCTFAIARWWWWKRRMKTLSTCVVVGSRWPQRSLLMASFWSWQSDCLQRAEIQPPLMRSAHGSPLHCLGQCSLKSSVEKTHCTGVFAFN